MSKIIWSTHYQWPVGCIQMSEFCIRDHCVNALFLGLIDTCLQLAQVCTFQADPHYGSLHQRLHVNHIDSGTVDRRLHTLVSWPSSFLDVPCLTGLWIVYLQSVPTPSLSSFGGLLGSNYNPNHNPNLNLTPLITRNWPWPLSDLTTY